MTNLWWHWTPYKSAHLAELTRPQPSVVHIERQLCSWHSRFRSLPSSPRSSLHSTGSHRKTWWQWTWRRASKLKRHSSSPSRQAPSHTRRSRPLFCPWATGSSKEDWFCRRSSHRFWWTRRWRERARFLSWAATVTWWWSWSLRGRGAERWGPNCLVRVTWELVLVHFELWSFGQGSGFELVPPDKNNNFLLVGFKGSWLISLARTN